MFKERLRTSVKKVGYGLLQFTLLVLTLTMFIGIVIAAIEFPVVGTIIEWTVYFIIGLIALLLIIVVAIKTCEFVNWLFIEPYKESKKKRML